MDVCSIYANLINYVHYKAGYMLMRSSAERDDQAAMLSLFIIIVIIITPAIITF